MNILPWINRLVFVSILLTFCVILLGAYTRLSDAGLGCPDWPGCYGQLTAPSIPAQIAAANNAYPQTPVDIHKARTEMTHRYFAETLGCFIVLFAALAYLKRHLIPLPFWLPGVLVLLVLFQGMLGMWTVTLKLLPIIVLGHLIGGFCTLGLLALSWLYLHRHTLPTLSYPRVLVPLAFTMLFVLIIQICLGGWTSTNYAALICPDFPTCQNQWWPQMDWDNAFTLFKPIDSAGKTAIHVMHRIGALCTFLLGTGLIYCLWQYHKSWSLLLASLLLLQAGLGVANVLFSLPLPIAVAHNGTAALLLLTLIALNFTLIQRRNCA